MTKRTYFRGPRVSPKRWIQDVFRPRRTRRQSAFTNRHKQLKRRQNS